MTKHVVVVGGGIAGLTTAYRLRTSGAPDLEITLVEGERRLGGKIITECVDGFTIEGGPDSFLTSKPGGLRLCHELGLLDRLRNTTDHPDRAFVKRQGALFALPQGLTGLVPTRLTPILRSNLLSLRGKLRMGFDLVRPGAAVEGDESVGSFTRRRLGDEAYRWLVEPLIGGIYAGDGDDLSLAATLPHMREAEQKYGSLIRGMIRMRERAEPALNGDGAGRTAFVAPAGGMTELVEAIAGRLGEVKCAMGTPVERIEKNGNGYAVELRQGGALEADAVVLATPAWVTAQLVDALDSELKRLLGQIAFAPCASVTVAYSADTVRRPLNAHGYVVPRSEGRHIVACTWVSSKFAQRAPQGAVLLRAFLGRVGEDHLVDWSDSDLLDVAAAEFRDVLGVKADPLTYRVYRWPRAMPQYTVGHLGRVGAIKTCLRNHPGLALAGNSYYGVGLPDTIASADRAAEAVDAHLEGRERQD